MPQPFRVSREEMRRIRSAARDRKLKRAEKAETLWTKRVKRPKSKTTAQLEDGLWEAFSLYIRLRDKRAAIAQERTPGCFYCESGPIECAMHRIKRGKRSTKYDERNVDGGCHRCNFEDIHNPQKFDAIFIKKKGAALFLELEEKGRQISKRSRTEVLYLTEFYRALLQAW